MKHAEQRSDPTKPIIVVWDNAPFHCTDVFRKALSAKYGRKIILCYLPTNTTSKLQPLDLSVNGALKQAAKKRFCEVAADKCVEQLLKKNTAYHDLHLNVSKVSSAKLVEITQTAWDRLTHDVVISGWRKSGLLEIFSKEKQSEATVMSMNGELPLKCLNTNRGKAGDELDNCRPVLDVFGKDDDCLSQEWQESFCDNDTTLDKDVNEEELAEMLARMRTTARTQALNNRPA
uniref:DDE-1 domain-containing protein n=1 Tax=Picochlorum oklahomense TaxID=249345 RepID=A0A7S1CVW1_9CHLO